MSKKSNRRKFIRNIREQYGTLDESIDFHVTITTYALAKENSRNDCHEEFIREMTEPDTKNLIFNRSEMDWIIDTLRRD
jgi:hypothetical protein